MNSYTVFQFALALTAASAAVVLQGPSRKTTLIGPEGSVISAAAPGGQVIAEQHPGVVAHAAAVPQVIAAVLVEPEVAAIPTAPLLAAPPLLHTVPAAEGQYLHDHSEALYDDGSYKPHLH
ncbi:hypothetical protein NQ315_007051 [Exocentrus adspersus]|uniref:Cuticle protein n=1 Tax=Exocentrus adspersus TaxID=1586481 RepID=A0AAV8WCJ6_9CUCU|nr:hypothetical protein NQ315_007051 [Exocentrus adspersus]